MDDPLSAALKELFGLNYLFPYQRLVISNILEAAASRGIKINWPGCDLNESEELQTDGENDRGSLGNQIVILPTGAGKSLCFQLPAMLLCGPTLVIYPILSLMADQERRLKEKDFSPVLLRGGQSPEERKVIWEKIRSGESRFVIANPEVLLSPQVLGKLKDMNFVHFVIDEAHCVSEWGESFRPSYLEINKIIEAASPPLITAFTATASGPVLEKIEKYIFGEKAGAHHIIGNPDRGNISYSGCGAVLKELAVRDLLLNNKRPAIVFCSSRKGTEKLARRLRNDLAEKEIRFYHAGLSREEKNTVEKWFFSSSEGVLVSTCAYGMGVDKPDIRTVIHRDCPPSVEAYLQESGRAGRDGEPSRAIILWGPGDEQSLNRAESGMDRKRLTELLDYARHTQSCRRDYLLRLLDYTADRDSPESDCCDVCEGKARPLLREEEAVADFVRRNRHSYTLDEAASKIAASGNIRCSEKEANELIYALVLSGKLKESQNPLWKKRLVIKW
ncbi:MAG: RecQ family ATP-dependent DNA helicase [Treponema sp.]|jgi:ATP-dependent DNA helicase RecQ|nr:RecQ family ATP-dependent DNA helicase [Treponema sp.]